MALFQQVKSPDMNEREIAGFFREVAVILILLRRKSLQSVTLKMNVPKDTWNVMSDLSPGMDRIEVPLFMFDEIPEALFHNQMGQSKMGRKEW